MNESDYKKEIKKLRLQHLKDQQRIEILEQNQLDLEQKITALINKNKELRKNVNYYDNSNTPSSANSLTRQRTNRISREQREQREKEGKIAKRGAKNGHKGVTRKNKVDETQHHDLAKCPKCGGIHIHKVGVTEKIVVDIPKPQRAVTTCHVIPEYYCDDCDCDVQSDQLENTNIPEKGIFGKNVCVLAIQLFAIYRLPYRKICQYLNQTYDLSISLGAIVQLIRNTGTKLGEEAKQIKNDLSKADTLHIDETAIHMNGTNVWIWAVYDPLSKKVLYRIRHGRGARELRSIMPAQWNGVVVCDGWRAYTTCPNRQRCWAHIIREVKHLSEQYPDDLGSQRVLHTLRDIRQVVLDQHSSGKQCGPDDLDALYKSSYRRTRRLIHKYQDHDILSKFMKKLGVAARNLLTFVTNPEIPSTNNAAERVIREWAVHRKIRGGLRSPSTMEWFANLLSCIVSWTNRKENVTEMLTKYV